jgi:phospholipid transport system substrate-binding protein
MQKVTPTMTDHRPLLPGQLVSGFAGFLAFLAISLTPFPAPAASAEIESAACDFVIDMSDAAINALAAPNIDRDERIERFRILFKDRFAVPVMGRLVLGRHWRKATPQERDEYLALFEDLMVASYVDRFARYTGESLTITKSVSDGKRGVTVFSEINRRQGGKAVRVDWRVASRGGLIKVVDVVIEGTSLSTTLRSDFASIIRREGSTVHGLIEILRAKTAGLRQSAQN